MDSRSGLVVGRRLTSATGKSAREVAQQMIGRRVGGQRLTLGVDKGYDTQDFVNRLRKLDVSPHIACKTVDSEMEFSLTVYPNYNISQTALYRVEEVFGWMKTVGVMRKTRHRDARRAGWMFTVTTAVYNLVRMRNLGLGVAA